MERRRVVLRLAALRFFFLAITVPPPFKGKVYTRNRNFPPRENFRHDITVLQIARNLNSIFDADYFSEITCYQHATTNDDEGGDDMQV